MSEGTLLSIRLASVTALRIYIYIYICEGFIHTVMQISYLLWVYSSRNQYSTSICIMPPELCVCIPSAKGTHNMWEQWVEMLLNFALGRISSPSSKPHSTFCSAVTLQFPVIKSKCPWNGECVLFCWTALVGRKWYCSVMRYTGLFFMPSDPIPSHKNGRWVLE